MRALINLLFFPGGLFLIVLALAYEYADRKLIARFENRIGPRWFQTVADIVKLLVKEEITPATAHPILFGVLPVVAMSGALTAALYVPLLGFRPALSFPGDLVVTLYLLSLLTMSIGIAGWNSTSRFTMMGATRALTQLFSYEAPFMLALLGPAVVAGSWQISEIVATNHGAWILLTQPFGFVVALIGLMGKLEMPPFDAPKAEDGDRGRGADGVQRARTGAVPPGQGDRAGRRADADRRALHGRDRQPDRVLRQDAVASV